jgi:hypothetical protein
MEYTSRKRRRELKSASVQSANTQSPTQKLSDEELFKEQKNRLRRQLNSASTFALETSDLRLSPHTAQTRTEVKKQKKIDDILRDIAVLPEAEYLEEDTNLRLLKKMSVAKHYNRLQLSPEQEEKMAENKEKFETITNQLWFLITELEKGKVSEPEMGTVPKIASEDVARNRTFFDMETAKTPDYMYGQIGDSEFEMTNINTKIDLLEEKLEKISLKNDELEDVLQDLEKVVQEGKAIVNDEVELQAYDLGEAPDDTLELLMYLEKVEALNVTKALKLEETRQNLQAETQAHERVQTEQQERTTQTQSISVNVPDTSATEVLRSLPTDEFEGTQEARTTLGAGGVKETGPQIPHQSLRSEPAEQLVIADGTGEENKALKRSIMILFVIFIILLSFLLYMIFNFIL